jgi:ribosome-associated protein
MGRAITKVPQGSAREVVLGPSGTRARFASVPPGDRPLTRKTASKPSATRAAKKSAKAAPKSKKASPKKAVKPKPKPKPKTKKAAPKPRKEHVQSELLKRIVASLEDDKAEAIVTVDLEGRSSLCDAAVIASGRSSRHVMSIAEHLARRLKEEGYGSRPVSGAGQGDWVLVDAGDVIVHVFRPEVREYYDLEGMWDVASPGRA